MQINEARTKDIERPLSKEVSEVTASAARKRRIVFEVVVGEIRVTGLSRPVWSWSGWANVKFDGTMHLWLHLSDSNAGGGRMLDLYVRNRSLDDSRKSGCR